MEIFDLYNRQGEKLNKTMIRGMQNQAGEYHKVVHLWIRNSKGEYLIQQRNKSTDRFPYQWAPTAGAVKKGEKAIDACLREAKEEIGIDIISSELKEIYQVYVDDDYANFIIIVYLLEQDVSIDECLIDDIEVKAIRYASFQQIQELLNNQKFWDFNPIDPNYFEIIERS